MINTQRVQRRALRAERFHGSNIHHVYLPACIASRPDSSLKVQEMIIKGKEEREEDFI